jgi:PhzF family phenazine biosynthesis protein
MTKQNTVYQVDAFTTEPFKGNPAAVCILDYEPSAEWMQSIAMEMNLSETAFVFPGPDCRILRFYTPEAEVQLCGHATLSEEWLRAQDKRLKKKVILLNP